MQHLFDSWTVVKRGLRGGRPVALFLDFDGTLAEIQQHPAQARLPDATRVVLRRLVRRGVKVCVVSGRDRSTLCRLIATPEVRCLGLYGWDDGGRVPLDAQGRAALRVARKLVAMRIRALTGVWLQNKGHSFTLHYRSAPADIARRAQAVLRSVCAPRRGLLRVIRAKRASEVLPASVPGKGEAVHRELTHLHDALAIYAGDDVTDEEAFRAMPLGITIHVGKRQRSHARFRLRNPTEVALFLEKLDRELAAVKRGTPRSRSDAPARAS
jgi:trehalose 6-phosphate phosphatase